MDSVHIQVEIHIRRTRRPIIGGDWTQSPRIRRQQGTGAVLLPEGWLH
jgi:hypothetical protein